MPINDYTIKRILADFSWHYCDICEEAIEESFQILQEGFQGTRYAHEHCFNEIKHLYKVELKQCSPTGKPNLKCLSCDTTLTTNFYQFTYWKLNQKDFLRFPFCNECAKHLIPTKHQYINGLKDKLINYRNDNKRHQNTIFRIKIS